MAISYTEPQQIRAGDTLSWRRVLPDYPAGTWTLVYVLINGSAKITITGTASDTEHVISVAKTVSDDYLPGWYDWASYVTNGTQRITIDAGRMQVLPDIAAATTYDLRSHAKKMLEAIESALEGKATKSQLDLLSAETGDRKMARDTEKLLVMRDRYRAEVAAEARAESVRRGFNTGRRIMTRLA